jgi:predicted metal-binding membrane protein
MIPAGMGLMVPRLAPWSGLEFALVFAMWVVMMIGMMTPSAPSFGTRAFDGFF